MTLMTRSHVVIALTCIAGLLTARPATAQPDRAELLRVRVHVSAEPRLKSQIEGYVKADLAGLRELQVTDNDPDVIVSLQALPTSAGGYAVSLVAMRVHSERELTSLAATWGIPRESRDRFTVTFKGAGALVDQRVQTGPDLQALCHALANAFAVETLKSIRQLEIR